MFSNYNVLMYTQLTTAINTITTSATPIRTTTTTDNIINKIFLAAGPRLLVSTVAFARPLMYVSLNMQRQEVRV